MPKIKTQAQTQQASTQHGSEVPHCELVVALAWKACARVEQKLAPCAAVRARLKDTTVWVEWVALHLSPQVLRENTTPVLAALVLQSAWSLEWGPQCHPLVAKAVQYLNLSAAENNRATSLRYRLLMLLQKSGRKGLPGHACLRQHL